MRGRPAPKRPSKPSLSASSRMKRLLRLPLHAEGRIGQQIVEARAGVAVVGEAVAELDVLEVLALHHQVAAADGIGLGVVLLAVALKARLRVELAQVVLGHREHAAGAAGRVAEGANDAGLGQCLAVRLEEQVHHEAGLPPRTPPARPRPPARRARLAGPGPAAPPLPPPHRARQALHRRHRRGRPRAGRLPVGRDHRSTSRAGSPVLEAGTTSTQLESGDRRDLPEDPRLLYAIPTRDPSARQLTTGHCPAVSTRASQSDSRRCRRDGRPTPAATTMSKKDHTMALDTRVHLSAVATSVVIGGATSASLKPW